MGRGLMLQAARRECTVGISRVMAKSFLSFMGGRVVGRLGGLVIVSTSWGETVRNDAYAVVEQLKVVGVVAGLRFDERRR